MKNFIILSFFIISNFFYSQKTEIINLNKGLKDKKELTKSLLFEDLRTDKEIGFLTYKEKKVDYQFQNDDLKLLVENQFKKDNGSNGTNDILVFLENLKVTDQPWGQYKVGKFNIKLSSFLKRGDRYYFIDRLEETYTTKPQDKGNIAKEISEEISQKINSFIKNSYSAPVSRQPIPENEIKNYNNYLKSNSKAFQNTLLLDGIYKNQKAFFNQEPTSGFSIEKNRREQVTGFSKNNETIYPYEVFCYVENGKAYKYTPIGFVDMLKDEKGFYIKATKLELFPPKSNSGAMVGAMAGGLVGAAIGAAIDSGSNSPNKRVSNLNERPRVDIDPLTGAYVFMK